MRRTEGLFLQLSNEAGPVLIRYDAIVAFASMKSSFDSPSACTRVILHNSTVVDVFESVETIREMLREGPVDNECNTTGEG